MGKKYRIYQVDSFTKDLFKGNPAGVVPDADGLTEAQMQSIARELNNSETAFILNPSDDSHEVWVRFFTPSIEVPSCGHATVAAHYVRALEKNLGDCTVVQKIGAGILPVEIIKEADDYKIVMTQGRIEFLDPFSDEMTDRILNAMGLNRDEYDSRCPVQIVSTGHSKVMIGIKSSETLNSLSPDFTALAGLSGETGCNGYYVFTFDSGREDLLTNGRMFAPAIGINEDPVTGNANGPLGAYIVKHNLVENDGKVFKFRAMQGEKINRTGFVDVDVEIENGQPNKVKIGGYAVVAFRTEIEI